MNLLKKIFPSEKMEAEKYSKKSLDIILVENYFLALHYKYNVIVNCKKWLLGIHMYVIIRINFPYCQTRPLIFHAFVVLILNRQHDSLRILLTEGFPFHLKWFCTLCQKNQITFSSPVSHKDFFCVPFNDKSDEDEPMNPARKMSYYNDNITVITHLSPVMLN